MRIRVLDPVDCEVEQSTGDELKWLKNLLSYRDVYYIRRQFGKQRKEYQASLVRTAKGRLPLFPTGFLPRLCRAAAQRGVVVDITGTVPRLEPTTPANVAGKTLRSDQEGLIDDAITSQRGVLVSPTGSGKTVVMMGLISRFPEECILIVTHTTSIVSQTVKELRGHGITGVCEVHGTSKFRSNARIVVATRQSLVQNAEYEYKEINGKRMRMRMIAPAKIRPEIKQWIRKVGVVIIDEVHLFGDSDSHYSLILRSMLAPIRIGLTGTAPTDEKIAMVLEGALGGTIGEVTYEDGLSLDILANVKLELIPVPERSSIKEIKNYQAIVEAGIVENKTRNRLIMEKARALVDDGVTVLIFIDKLVHGDRLIEMAELVDLEAIYIEGETDKQMREWVKQGVIDSRVRCVISSKIWREGVNIPNLGAVILAGGGKAELSILQAIGRGLRKADGKHEAVIVDFLDPYHHLAEHTIQRLSVYKGKGWL